MTTNVGINGALALVTGAGRGIGRATAEALAAAGARLVVVDIDGPSAEATVAAIGAAGGDEAWAYRVDVSDPAGVAALSEQVLSAHGVPDILVNNAGVGMTGRFLDMTLDDWTWIISINLVGAVNICRAFGPAMVARHSGQVVNVSSGLAYMPRGTETGYVTTKAAILAFSQCLRADWHGEGIGVSVVCPGVINTDMVKRNTRYLGPRADADVRRRVVALFARGHPPGQVAAAVIDAITGNRSIVPVGFEARIGWWLRRLLPTALVDLSARHHIGGV